MRIPSLSTEYNFSKFMETKISNHHAIFHALDLECPTFKKLILTLGNKVL
jgi:hypothetical protein